MRTARKHLKTYAIICILSAFIPGKIFAQKQKINQSLIWYAYYNNLKFSSKFRLQTDIQERQFILPVGAQSTYLFRTILYYNLGGNWEVGAGPAVFFNNTSDIPSANKLSVPELRPTIDFLNRQSIGDLKISHAYRFEFRFQHNVDSTKTNLDDGFTFSNYRFRYKLGLEYPLVKNKDKKTILSARVSDEILLNLGNKIAANTFDQNRVYAGLACKVSPSFSVELGYMNWFQELKDGKSFYNRDIYRIAVTQNIELHKKKSEKNNTLK